MGAPLVLLPWRRRRDAAAATAVLLLLLLLLCSTLGQCFDLTVLHTNDLHSRFDEVTSRGSSCKERDRREGKCFGGVARIKSAADNAREEAGRAAILVNAGDFFQVIGSLLPPVQEELIDLYAFVKMSFSTHVVITAE